MTPIPADGSDASTPQNEQELLATLRRMKMVSADQLVALTPLAGGVSSDIFRADLPSGVVCVKRALTRLKVAADWQVPVERNRSEVAWMRVAGEIVPDAVPAILGEDREACAFAMAWLPPEQYPVWKTLLAAGGATTAMAARVGDTLGRIHAATADRPDLAWRFANDALFHALRLDPYLVTAARRHPRQASRLQALVEVTAGTRRVLVHGDFSPKNLLIGPQGPVILDAECAVYGDPAFDLAFVLSHLLLKGVWHPPRRDAYSAMARALVAAYHGHVEWESAAALEARTAALLPGLMLARVDGKSPVEYVTRDSERDMIRAFACAHLDAPVATLEQFLHAWTT